MSRGARLAAAALVGVLVSAVAAGCGDAGPTPLPAESPPASPFEACPPAQSPPAQSQTESSQTDNQVPDLTLPCFTGAEPVALARLGKPAIINLWASTCEPCREEMPALQAFADERGDDVLVLGVNTGDSWNAAAWVGIEFGVRYPSVFDPDRTLAAALGRMTLPVSLFVDADGAVRGTDVSGSLTLEELRALARDHLGIGA